jgi:hypothetical protein
LELSAPEGGGVGAAGKRGYTGSCVFFGWVCAPASEET